VKIIFYKPLEGILAYLQFWCTWDKYELIRFRGQKVKGQGCDQPDVVQKGATHTSIEIMYRSLLYLV